MKTIRRLRKKNSRFLKAMSSGADCRAESESALIDSQLRSLAEILPDIMFILDRDGMLTYVNSHAAAWLGKTAAEVTGKNQTLFFPPETAARHRHSIEYVFETKSPLLTEELYHPEGQAGVWLESRLIPLLDKHENVALVMGVSRDITRRKQAEIAVKESELRLRQIIDLVPHFIFAKDRHGRFILANKAKAAAYGLTVEEFLGKTDADLNHAPDEVAHFLADDREVMDSGKRKEVPEEKITDAAGNTRYLDTIKIPFHIGPTGEDAVLGVCTDITKRILSEKALDHEKELLLVTLRSIADGVITTDASGAVTLMNSVAEQLTGWKDAESRGRMITEIFTIVTSAARESCENPVEKVFRTGAVQQPTSHLLVLPRGGRSLLISDSAAPIRDAGGTIIGAVFVFRDITEREKIQESLKNAQKLESLGVLAGGLAHDFNNLLTGMFGYIHLARKASPERSETAEMLDEVLRIFDRTRDLTQQLITFSKGGSPLKSFTRIESLARETVAFALAGSNVIPEFDFPEGLWYCEIDGNQVRQVIDNIIINARQEMKGGGRVFVGAENCECLSGCPAPLVPGRYVTLSIRDEGGGIDPEYLHRIFDPFFTTKEQGSGLGLAISYSIIKKHGGHLIVNSEPGHGATFQIYLPATEKIPLPIATPAKNEFRGKGKLLVIDDKEYIRIVAQNMLVDMGFSVVTAADGESGLYHFRKATHDGAPFTGVILDLTIPGGKSGTEIARELNQIDPAARVIVSSGYSDDPVMASPSRYGFSGRLSKPYTFEEFGKVLEEVLRTRDG